ncbi:MAG: 2-dehydropantoate 2-reductase [Psychrosphaera sp.]|nr:2-dehydropantoate 2-reductase [Psychrosphaera sp.]
MTQKTILLVGAGAVGATIAAWLAPKHQQFYVYDRPDTVKAINESGISSYKQHQQDQMVNTAIKTIDNFADFPTPDIILLCVKNYSLDGLSKAIVDAYGGSALKDTIVVGLQNGVKNQQILPKYFNNVVYGIISYNAWLDETTDTGGVKRTVAGYQAKGPFIFGTPDNSNQAAVQQVTDAFNQGVEATASQHFQDAALSKMIINLTNSFTTLSGLGYREIDNAPLFQKILSRLTNEGVNIVKAAGFKECKVGDIPSWLLIRASALLPQFLTRKLFAKNVKKMVLSSMAQDIIQNGRTDNELHDINGYLLGLADQFGVDAPYNKAMYQLCQSAFAAEQFSPMRVDDIWRKMAVG